MSFTAFVAFESNGTYDLHYSHNGGEEYVLYPLLQKWVADDETNRDMFNFPAGMTSAANAIAGIFSGEDTETRANHSASLIQPDPVETDLQPRELFAAVRTYETEVVYVVSDDAVELFVPVNPSPHAFSLLSEHATVNMYRFDNQHQLNFLINQRETIDPVTFAGSGFSSDGIREKPDWAQDTLRDAHRYILNSIRRATELDGNHDTSMQNVTVLDGVFIETQITSPESAHPAPVDDFGIPITVTWNNEVPSYPMYFADGNYGSRPKLVANTLRFDAHCSVTGDITAKREYIRDGLIDAFSDDISVKYLPEAFDTWRADLPSSPQ